MREKTITALDDVSERAFIRCENPALEINVPVNINAEVMIQHLFGQVHLLDRGWLGLDDNKSETENK